MREEWESNSRYTGRRTERRGKRRKRHRIRRIIKCIFCIALIIPVITVVLWARDMITGRGNLAVMALTDPKVREVVAHKDQYPEELIELLENNAETADFVLGYPEKKDTPGRTDGDIWQGF